jgi:hypothetical protein
MIALGIALSRTRKNQAGFIVRSCNESARRQRDRVLAEEVEQPETVN